MAVKKCIALILLALCFSGALYAQSLTTVVLPLYIEGINGTNANRIPFAFRASITGLTANATYHYINQCVLSSDVATANGSGNCIFASPSGSFIRTSSPGLVTAGTYGVFTADASGNYEGWFITEPTGNARFVPGGYIFMRIALNDGGTGTVVATRLTTADSVRVEKLDPAAADSAGTGLRCTSALSPKNFVFVYDDTSASGRPLSGSFIEDDGSANTTANNYAAFYGTSVNGVNGAFGLVLPNVLPNGVRRIDQRSLADGTLVTSAADSDGIWPSGANTINPSGGTTEIVMAGTDLVAYTLTVNATHGSVTRLPDRPSYQHGTNVQLTVTPDSGYHFVAWTGDVLTGHETDNPLTVTMDTNRVLTASIALATSAPTLIAPTSAGVASGTALLGATIASDGNSPILERGVVWSLSASPTTADNKVVASDTTATFVDTVNGLPAGTLIHFRGYAINGTGTGYSPDGTFFTLSSEPSTQAGSFHATAVSMSQINLSWSVATGATGYIILDRSGSDPTGLPHDAIAYAVGDTIVDGIVAAKIPRGDSASVNIAGLTASVSYHFAILPFAWDGSHPATINYNTGGTIPRDSATTFPGPQIAAVVLPQYIQGNTGTNANRIPFAYRARLTYLMPRATYRFANQIVIPTDTDSADGSGNCIFVPATGDFIRTSGPDLATSGNYGEFTADSVGSYAGWFVTEPTGNKRFVPGSSIFMRIWMNDGASGTVAVTHLTIRDSVRVLKLDPAASDSTGTGIRGMSAASQMDFAFAYDNTSGSGRPLSGSYVENDGTDNSLANHYASFYAARVDGVSGAFGVVAPNALPSGIRRVEWRSRATGAVVGFATDADGVWPSGANTVNPTGGPTEIVLTGSDLQEIDAVGNGPTVVKQFALLQNYPNPFNPATEIRYQVPTAGRVYLKVYDILGREVATLVDQVRTAGSYTVTFNASTLASGLYFYRMTAGNFIQTKRMLLLK
jgi:hypothetical protein